MGRDRGVSRENQDLGGWVGGWVLESSREDGRKLGFTVRSPTLARLIDTCLNLAILAVRRATASQVRLALARTFFR